MTTTTLTSYASTYEVGTRHVHFDLRSSSPTTGDVYEGIGEFRVYRSGVLIESANNVHEFGWPGEDGDVVHARYSDMDGDHGDWESYTYSVSGAYSLQYYVNGSTGDDADPGTSSEPFATIGQAVTTVRASLTSGQVAAIHVAEGQSYDQSGAAIWAGGTTARCVHFLRWGDASTRPAITNCQGLSTGMRESFVVDGIDLTGAAGGYAAANLTRSGGLASDRSPYNIALRNCELSSWDRGVDWDDSGSFTDRTVQRFIELTDVTMDQNRVFHIYGYAYPECLMFRNVALADVTGGGASPIRMGRIARSYFKNWTVLPTASATENSARLIMGNASGEGAMHSVSFDQCQFKLHGTYGLRLESDSTGNWMNNITWNACEFDSEATSAVNEEINANGKVTTDVMFRNCSFGQPIYFNTNASVSNGYDNIRFVNCIGSRRNWIGEGIVRTGGDATTVADDCFEGHSCAAHWAPDPDRSDDTRSFFQVPTAAKVASATYIHLGKAGPDDTPDQGIINGSTATGTNSSTYSTTFNLTASGWVFGALDAELTSATVGDTELAGTGKPHDYSIDANGFLRHATTPDAGPFEFGGSTAPDNPDVGGVTYTLTADAGSFAVSGQGAGLLHDRALVASAGSFATSGQDATLSYGAVIRLTAESGQFSLTGQSVALTWSGAPTPPAGPSGNLSISIHIGF